MLKDWMQWNSWTSLEDTQCTVDDFGVTLVQVSKRRMYVARLDIEEHRNSCYIRMRV